MYKTNFLSVLKEVIKIFQKLLREKQQTQNSNLPGGIDSHLENNSIKADDQEHSKSAQALLQFLMARNMH